MAEVTMETMNWEWIDETAQQTELDGMMGCIEEAQENITDGLYLRMMNHLKNINNKYSVKERNKTLLFAHEYHDECNDEIRRGKSILSVSIIIKCGNMP